MAYVRPFISDVIKANLAHGLEPVLMPGKKLVMLFTCPICGKLKMTKFKQGKARKQQCVCGHLRHSKGFVHKA